MPKRAKIKLKRVEMMALRFVLFHFRTDLIIGPTTIILSVKSTEDLFYQFQNVHCMILLGEAQQQMGAPLASMGETSE